MLSLRDLVGDLTKHNSIFRTLKDQFALQQFWVSQFDANITGQAQVNRIEDGILIFDVRSPVWTAQLKFYTQTILEKFQKQWPDIRNLRFQNLTNFNLTSTEESREPAISPIAIEPLPENIIERLRMKARYLLQRRLASGWKICKICQSTYLSWHTDECFLCRQKIAMKKRHGMAQQIEEAPWARNLEGGDEMIRLREKLRNQTYDKIKNLFWQFQKEPTQQLKKQMASLMQQYTSLKTGLSPQELNDKIISEAIGNAFYQRWLKISKK